MTSKILWDWLPSACWGGRLFCSIRCYCGQQELFCHEDQAKWSKAPSEAGDLKLFYLGVPVLIDFQIRILWERGWKPVKLIDSKRRLD